ncbi:MAG: hypothetical protein NT106_13495 [Candidatus Sumerlaeota bacterium]|nr:hypothetical protein [Candidatus Sumerlaeota bacterium]
MMKIKMGFFSLLFAVLSVSAIALNYDVNYTGTPPAIDGTIDTVWSSASAAASIFKDNTDGATISSQQTYVRLLWDLNKIYILFEADDNAIVASATANDTGFDFSTPQDTAEIIFDPADGQDTSVVNDYVYHITVNPAAIVYTYTEAGQNSLGWDLGIGSQIAFATSGTNWRIEMAIPWSEFNSTLANSPGVLMGSPGNGSVWGAQFGRLHGGGSPANNTVASKWDIQSFGAYFRTRPIGTITFTGGPAATGLNVSSFTSLFACGFESAATYTAGSTINTIEGWACSDAPTFVATAAEKVSGSQGLEILPNSGKTVTSPPGFTSPSGITVVQYAVKLPTEMGTGSKYKHVIYINGTTTLYETIGQVWFYGSPDSSPIGQAGNVIRIIAFDINPDEITSNSYYFPGLQTLGEWSYITVKVDESTRKFSVFYNGRKLADPSKPDGEYYIKHHSSSTFSFGRVYLYAKNFGTSSVFMDDFGQYSATISTVGNWDMY